MNYAIGLGYKLKKENTVRSVVYEFTSCFYVFMCQWDPHISQIVFSVVATVSINIQKYHLPLRKRALSWWKQRRSEIWGGKKKEKVG